MRRLWDGGTRRSPGRPGQVREARKAGLHADGASPWTMMKAAGVDAVHGVEAKQVYSRGPPGSTSGYRGRRRTGDAHPRVCGHGCGRPGPGDLRRGWPVALHSKVTPPRPALLCSGAGITNAGRAAGRQVRNQHPPAKQRLLLLGFSLLTLPTDAK